MENIFNVIDIWLNIIPHVDYRTFYIIKRLNKTINRDCHIKRKPLIEDLKNWSFYLKPTETKPSKDISEWKQIKKKKSNPKTYQTDLAFIERVKLLDYISFTKFLIGYLFGANEQHQLEYCLSMLIPGDTIDIKMDQVIKVPYKFYFDGTNFIKMNYTMDYGKWISEYNRREHDWEERWESKYQNEYVYPEHVLQFVGYDLNKFLQDNKCLIHVSHIFDLEYVDNYYSPHHGNYGSYNIGLDHLFPTQARYQYRGDIREFSNILINSKITLKTERPIYAFKSK